MIAENEDELRAGVRLRFDAWRAQGAPPRTYALLVSQYYARHYPYADWELVQWVTESAGRPLTDEERVSAAECAERDGRRGTQEQINNSPIYRDDLHGPVLLLRMALTDPQQAAEQLGGRAYGNSTLVGILECLRPSAWERPAPDWTPPPEAIEWARRIDAEGAFGELPILADLLEDAGCPDRPLLDHCRKQDCHRRGCAALDRILSIEQRESAPHLRLLGTNELEGRVWWFSDPFEVGVLTGLFLSDVRPYSVSRRHAAVSHDGTGWRIADRNSTNGTYLNGVRLGGDFAGPLRTGDTLQFGSAAFRVVFAAPGGVREGVQ